MREDRNSTPPAGKIYTERMVAGGTLFGGPLVAGYMMASNYRVFGDRDKFVRTWLVTILVTVAVFTIAYLIPENLSKLAGTVLAAAYSAAAMQMARTCQSDPIARHKASGGEAASGWQVAGVVLVWLAVTLAAIFAGVFITGDLGPEGDPGPQYASCSYGTLQHTIYFDDQNVTVPEVDAFAKVLTRAVFFDDEMQKSVLLAKEGDAYLLTVPVVVGIADHPDRVVYFTNLRHRIAANSSDQKIVLQLAEDGDPERVVKRFE